MTNRTQPTLRLLVTLAAVFTVPLGVAQQDAEADLERLREEIARFERELDRQISRRDDGMAELRAVEEVLAGTRAELRELGQAMANQAERAQRIESDRQTATELLADEQQALAEQIRSAYLSGRREIVRLLLSHESPTDLGRMLTYFDYLNSHRVERMSRVDAQLARLAELANESAEVSAELSRLRATELKQLNRLEQERAEREAVVAELNTGIDSAEQRIARMREEEAQLDAVIARLAELRAAIPVSSDVSFSQLRGNLEWPVSGEIGASFGEARDAAGRVRWNGVLIEAETGSPVKAVAHGRVMHAQWTPGMGLLTILDHGDGYMSVYGHNSVLLRGVGDWVLPGEVIAEVGDSGGQLGEALYFELRRDGEPVDPAGWVR